jgi:hypothetical protein
MLKYLPVSRSAHDSLHRDNAKLHELVAEWELRTKGAKAERDEAKQERDASDLAVILVVEQRDIARELLTRALTQLSKVDAKRTGGVPMRVAIANIVKDATEHGLWGEVKE